MPQTGSASVARVQLPSPPMPCSKFADDVVSRSADSTSNCWAAVDVPGAMSPARAPVALTVNDTRLAVTLTVLVSVVVD